MWETWVQLLGWEDALEKGTAIHSSVLAWKFHGLYGPWGCKEWTHDWENFTFTEKVISILCASFPHVKNGHNNMTFLLGFMRIELYNITSTANSAKHTYKLAISSSIIINVKKNSTTSADAIEKWSKWQINNKHLHDSNNIITNQGKN